MELILCGNMKEYQIIYTLNGVDKVGVVSMSVTNHLTREETEESVILELKKEIGYHSSKDKIKIHSIRPI